MLAYLTNLVMFSTDPAAVAALGDAAAQQLLDGMSPSVAALLRAGRSPPDIPACSTLVRSQQDS